MSVYISGKKSIIASVIIFMLLVGDSPGGTVLTVETPPFDDSSTWSIELVPGVSGGTSGANESSGSVATYATAWVGGASATANQYIGFNVPADVSVNAKIELMATRTNYNFAHASFSGFQWQWKLDDGDFHSHELGNPFSWDVILWKIINLVGLLGGNANTVTQAIAYMSLVTNAGDLALYLAGMGDDTELLILDCSFTAKKGYHTFGVGVRSNATAAFTGSSTAIMFGQIQKITLKITDGNGGTPDMVISDIQVTEGELKRGEKCKIKITLCNMGNGSAFNDNCKLSILEPGADETVPYDGANGRVGGSAYIKAVTTKEHVLSYTFNKKGYYSLFAIADDLAYVDESDEGNNWMEKMFYVKGFKPNKPGKPTFPDAPSDRGFYLNNSYTVNTTASDPDGDTLQYQFWRKSDLDPTWQPLSGWVDTPGITIGPFTDYSSSTFYVKVQAVDSDGLRSEFSEEQSFFLHTNQAPQNLTISGPTTGDTIQLLPYTVNCTDREHDGVFYRFDWGDGSDKTKWYYAGSSSTSLSLSHNYSQSGKYNIQVEAKDSNENVVTTSYSVTITNYVSGQDSIVVTTNFPGIGFDITGPNELSGTTDSYGVWTSQALPGTYSIAFDGLPGYLTPTPPSQSLSAFGSINFNGTYIHGDGDIYIYSNVYLDGRVLGSGAASGRNHTIFGYSWSKIGTWSGQYTVRFKPVDDYCLPSNNGETKTLEPYDIIFFDAKYIKPPVVDLSFTLPHLKDSTPYAIAQTDAIEFDGSGSYSPAENAPEVTKIAKYEFDLGDGYIYTETESDAPDGNFDGKFTYAYDLGGVYWVRLTVYDTDDNPTSILNPDYVYILAKPEAHMEINPSSAIAGETVYFQGWGTDPDDPLNTIKAYRWHSSIDGDLFENKTFSTNELTPSDHDHIITLKVQDNDDLWSDAAEAVLHVYPPRNWPMFKKDNPRLSHQNAYRNRDHGRLDYDKASPATTSWPYIANGIITGSAAAANLDGNWENGLEIAVASSNGTLYILDKNGNFIWSKNVGPTSSTPTFGDLDNDGRLDVVIGSQTGLYGWLGRMILSFLMLNTSNRRWWIFLLRCRI